MPTDPTTTTTPPAASTEAGNVFGPNQSTDDAVARFDGTSGKVIQNSAVGVTDGGALELRGASAIVRPAATNSGPGENLMLLGGKVDGPGNGNGGEALLTGGDGDEGGQTQVAAGQSFGRLRAAPRRAAAQRPVTHRHGRHATPALTRSGHARRASRRARHCRGGLHACARAVGGLAP